MAMLPPSIQPHGVPHCVWYSKDPLSIYSVLALAAEAPRFLIDVKTFVLGFYAIHPILEVKTNKKWASFILAHVADLEILRPSDLQRGDELDTRFTLKPSGMNNIHAWNRRYGKKTPYSRGLTGIVRNMLGLNRIHIRQLRLDTVKQIRLAVGQSLHEYALIPHSNATRMFEVRFCSEGKGCRTSTES